MPYVLFSMVCLFWGANFVLLKKAVPVFGPLTIASARLAGAALALGLVLAWVRGRSSAESWRVASEPVWRRSDLATWAGLVLVGFVFAFVTQPYLIGRVSHSGFIGVLVAFVPLFTLGWSALILRARPTVRQGAGVLLGLAAMPLLLGVGTDLGLRPWELALALAVPAASAWANTAVKARMGHVRPAVLTALCCGLAAGLIAPLALARETVRWPDAATGWAAVGAVFVLGVVGTGFGTVMFYRLIQLRGPLFAGMVTYVIPVEAVLWGALDGEAVMGRQVVALAVALGAVALVQWPGGGATRRRGAAAVSVARGSTRGVAARRG